MRTFQVDNLEIGYRTLLDEVLNRPDRTVSPRGEGTREIDTMVIEHHEPDDALLVGVGRKLSPTLAAVEGLQLVGGFSDPDVTVDVAPQYERFRDGDAFHGAYGHRTGYWMQYAVAKLQQDPNTRQAVIALWKDSVDNEKGKHDYPCSVYVRFAIRDEKLRTSVHMRSNDAWLGYPYDVYQWTLVHRTVASFLDVEPGVYTHIVDSFHLYDRNVEDVESMLAGPFSSGNRPRLRGGIGWEPRAGEFRNHTWEAVQKRAQGIFNGYHYSSHSSANREEERYLIATMARYRGNELESDTKVLDANQR